MREFIVGFCNVVKTAVNVAAAVVGITGIVFADAVEWGRLQRVSVLWRRLAEAFRGVWRRA